MIHGDVGFFQQFIGNQAVFRVQADTDAWRDEQRMFLKIKRSAQNLDNRIGNIDDNSILGIDQVFFGQRLHYQACKTLIETRAFLGHNPG